MTVRATLSTGPRGYLLYVAASFLLAGGCGGNTPSAAPVVYPTKGKVFLGSSPVRLGRIHLEPVVLGEGTPCWGDIGEDGSFVIRTVVDGDGAAPGRYQVWIEPYSFAINGLAKVQPTKIPFRYTEPATSGLSVEIQEGENVLPPLELKP